MLNRLPLAVSALALTVALTGAGAQAAGVFNGSQIMNGTIGVAKLTPKAIKQLHGLKGDRGQRGFSGTDGSPGFDGAQGPAGATGVAGGFNPAKVSYVQGPTTYISPGQTLAITAFCPAGTIGISGGYFNSLAYVAGTVPGTNGYGVVMDNTSSISIDVYAFAVCAAP
jgi:hypothetical protein